MTKTPDSTTAALYEMSVHGWFTEESGNVEAPTGWFAWTEILPTELDSVVDAFADEFAELDDFDPAELVGGWILYEDSQGFVDAVRYELSPVPGYSDARIAFRTLENEYCGWADIDDDDDDA